MKLVKAKAVKVGDVFGYWSQWDDDTMFYHRVPCPHPDDKAMCRKVWAKKLGERDTGVWGVRPVSFDPGTMVLV